MQAAALQAKQQGQTDTAKEYLRQALSFNKLIEVSKAGLPVDMGTLPLPPQMQVVSQSTHITIFILNVCQTAGFALQEVFVRHPSDINTTRSKVNRISQSSTPDDQVNNNKSDESTFSTSPFSPCFQFIFNSCVKKSNKVNVLHNLKCKNISF